MSYFLNSWGIIPIDHQP